MELQQRPAILPPGPRDPLLRQFIDSIPWTECLVNPHSTTRTIPRQCITRCAKVLAPFWDELTQNPQDETCWKTILIFPHMILRQLPRPSKSNRQRPTFTAIHQRLDLFEKHNLNALWTTSPNTRHQRTNTSRTVTQPGEIEKKTKRRIKFLTSLRRIGAAVDCLIDRSPFITPGPHTDEMIIYENRVVVDVHKGDFLKNANGDPLLFVVKDLDFKHA